MIFFLLFLGITPCLADPVPQNTQVSGDKLSKILAPFNAYFQNLKCLQATLEQTNNNEQKTQAKLFIKPSRLRLITKDYELRARDKKLVHYDLKTHQTEELIIDQTPLYFLFSKKRLEDVAFVDAIHTFAHQIELTLRNKKDPKSGTLTLIFKRKPFTLVGWSLRDADNKVIYVELKKLSYNINSFDDRIFINP